MPENFPGTVRNQLTSTVDIVGKTQRAGRNVLTSTVDMVGKTESGQKRVNKHS